MDVSLRRQTPDDLPAIRSLVEAAFADEGPLIVELIDALEGHPCGRDRLSLVAESGGSVVGHALVTRGRLDTFRRTLDVGVLSPVAVDPRHHGRGIGTSLVAAAITVSGDTGLPALFVEGDPGFYSRVGFSPGRPLGFRKPSIRIPDRAFQVVLLDGYEGWMTGTLVYPEPFWDLDCVGLRDPEFLDWLALEAAQGREL